MYHVARRSVIRKQYVGVIFIYVAMIIIGTSIRYS